MIDDRTVFLKTFVCSVLTAAAMSGCGSKGTSNSSTASASVEVSAVDARDQAEALAANDPPKLPPIEIGKPQPQKIGDKAVIGEVCKTNGPIMKGGRFDEGIGQIALDPDGAIYVLDNEHRLRKYLARAVEYCELILDPTFGEKGILTVATGDEKPDSVVADTSGHLYVSDLLHVFKTTQIIDGKLAGEVCKQTFRLHVDASGKSGTMNKQKVVIDAGKCTGEGLDTKAWDATYHSTDILPLGDGFAAIGSVSSSQKIGLLSADQKVTATLGGDDGDQQICSIASVVPCSLGICVVDANCRGLRVWAADGKWVGAGKLAEMAGLVYPWPLGLAVGKNTAYMTMTHAPKSSTGENSYGFIVRVTGLARE